MNETFNIYCDESCHLESDHQKAMVLDRLRISDGSSESAGQDRSLNTMMTRK